MHPSTLVIAARTLIEANPVWAWALAVTAVGLLVAALMVLVQDDRPPGRRGATWGVVIFVLPIIGPAFYLVFETVRHRREHGRPQKGPVERYAPEEVAQRREDARREQTFRDQPRRDRSERDDDRDARSD